MIDLTVPLFTIVIPFLIGSIPTGYWLGRLYRGIDIRSYSSGNLGATNVFRVLGWKAGLVTLLIDILKGFIAVGFVTAHLNARNSYLPGTLPWSVEYGPDWVAAISAILGHSFSPFVKFRGGKGVATAAGALLVLLPREAGISLLVFLFIFSITRIVSLSSMLASIALVVTTFLISHEPHVELFTTSISIFIIWRHRENIVRLLNGTEKPLQSNAQN